MEVTMKMRIVLPMLALLLAQNLYAKRLAPEDVAPVTHDGLTYKVEHWESSNKIQNGGVLEVYKEGTEEKIKSILVYKVTRDDHLEEDAQDTFITTLKLSEDKKSLIVVNEEGDTYQVSLKDYTVTKIEKPSK